ncbi:hypothetical protein N185_17310 [Sinorhizobium sp. GW3]|nr:hypothetical protein N185_17310 [Sinorhizobium sp. GW3]
MPLRSVIEIVEDVETNEAGFGLEQNQRSLTGARR